MAPRPPSARPPSSDVPSARTAAAERASYRQVLGHGEFRAIFAADVVSMLGNVVAAVALTVLVYQRTHSPALAASVMTLAFLPYLFGGILLGAAADRLPARGVLVGCDLISASLVGVMVIPGIPVAGMLALLFVAGLVSPVYSGARSALLPGVLTPGPRYVLGRALLRTVAQSAQIVGYGLGGLLLAALSPRGALAVDAVSFAASAAVLRFGTAARRPRAGRVRAGPGPWHGTPWPDSGRCSPTGRSAASCCSAGWCPHVRSRPRHLPPPTSPLSACRPGPLASC